MSKKLTLVISLLLITCIFFGTMAACGGGSKQGGTSTTPTPAETPTTDTKTKPTDTGTSDGETFRLGIIYPLTGDLSKFGQEEIKGVEIAADLVNAQGGINGIPIELVKADAPTPDAATAEVERLINVEKVHAIMGSYSSGVAYAGSAVAEKNQTV